MNTGPGFHFRLRGESDRAERGLRLAGLAQELLAPRGVHVEHHRAREQGDTALIT